MNLIEIWKEDTILDAGGNRSARKKPARASMDREPNSHTTLTRLGIEPGRIGERHGNNRCANPPAPKWFLIKANFKEGIPCCYVRRQDIDVSKIIFSTWARSRKDIFSRVYRILEFLAPVPVWHRCLLSYRREIREQLVHEEGISPIIFRVNKERCPIRSQHLISVKLLMDFHS